MRSVARIVPLCVVAVLGIGCPPPPPAPPDLVVDVVWDGATAEQIEAEVLAPLESRLGGTKWLSSVSGAAWDGRAEVRLRFDPLGLPDETKASAQQLLGGATVPAGADIPTLREAAASGEVLEAVLGSDASAAELATWIDGVETVLAATPGVRGVELRGLGEPRLRVALDARLLDRKKLDAAAVTDKVRVCVGPQASLETLQACDVGPDPAAPVPLSDVAALEQITTWDERVWFDGKPAVRLVARVDTASVEAARAQLTTTRGPGQAWLVLLPPSSVQLELEGSPTAVDQGRKRVDEAVVGDAWMVAEVFADGRRASLDVGLPPETDVNEALAGLRKSSEITGLAAMARTPTTRCMPITVSGGTWTDLGPVVPQVVDALRQVDGFVGAVSTSDAGKSTIAVSADSERLAKEGVTQEALGRRVALATTGERMGRMGAERMPVIVTLGRGNAVAKDLGRVVIAGNTSVSDVATLGEGPGRVLPVRHEAGIPQATVEACIAPRDLPSVLEGRAKTAVGKLDLPEGVTVRIGAL